MRVYYAHCIALYNTPQEARDLLTLEMMGLDVTNPNDPAIEGQCEAIRIDMKAMHVGTPAGTYGTSDAHLTLARRAELQPFKDASAAIMALVFQPLVSAAKCDVVAFRALPDGRIPAGVAQEVAWARPNGIPVIELPANYNGRVMTVDATRDYLAEVGQR